MKKIIVAFLLIFAFALALPLSASAESQEGASGWTVNYTTAGRIDSNFSSSAIQDAISGLQPGDDITFTITVKNTSTTTVDWYMLNEVIKTLETSRASGGGYSYQLSYKTSAGKTREFYDSDTVGGEANASGAEEGLKEVNSALKSYLFLESMPAGRSGTVTLKVALDGESQGNVYQNTVADIRLRFAAEAARSRRIVRTGDDGVPLAPLFIGMGVFGLLLFALALDGFLERRKRGEGQR